MRRLANRRWSVRRLAHWRTWTNAGTVVFSGWLLAVIAEVQPPGVPASLFSLGMPISVGFFLVGFALLAWRQAAESE
ncbi:hypothetical protein M0R89_19775 (plasmid) [Halorussus limi]|uniref:Uncharacterized protein n=1 Tax=Halorussus limi TaxID=2938695 RepID=A0A8U0HZ13_9EURY|nr:hypothetical protein [Halorussus limi]UPV76402.1 hypothetical protein M0R89_19775 [Halorussus limi]